MEAPDVTFQQKPAPPLLSLLCITCNMGGAESHVSWPSKSSTDFILLLYNLVFLKKKKKSKFLPSQGFSVWKQISRRASYLCAWARRADILLCICWRRAANTTDISTGCSLSLMGSDIFAFVFYSGGARGSWSFPFILQLFLTSRNSSACGDSRTEPLWIAISWESHFTGTPPPRGISVFHGEVWKWATRPWQGWNVGA